MPIAAISLSKVRVKGIELDDIPDPIRALRGGVAARSGGYDHRAENRREGIHPKGQ
jgi:hypothetical protein